MEMGAALSKQHCRSRGLPLSDPTVLVGFSFAGARRPVAAHGQSSGTCANPNNTSAIAAINNHVMLRTTSIRIVDLLSPGGIDYRGARRARQT